MPNAFSYSDAAPKLIGRQSRHGRLPLAVLYEPWRNAFPVSRRDLALRSLGIGSACLSGAHCIPPNECSLWPEAMKNTDTPHDRSRALVLTAEMAHQDPRVSWNLEVLSRHYDVTIAPATDCNSRARLAFYHKWRVLSCGRIRDHSVRSAIVDASRLILCLPGLLHALIHGLFQSPRVVLEILKCASSQASDPKWFFTVGRCLKMHVAVWSAIHRTRYDLIWCHEFIMVPTAVRYRCRYPRCRIVWDEHEIGVIPPLRHSQAKAAAAVDAFVSVSEPIMEYQTRQLPALKSKAFCVPNIPTVSRPLSPQPAHVPIRWVIVGMESPHLIHALRTFFGTWERHAPKHCSLDCFIMQNSHLAYEPSQAFKDTDVRNVVFRKPLPHELLTQELRSYDIGVVPYALQGLFRQACPNKVGEYIHAGLAVLLNADLEWYGRIVTDLGCGVVSHLFDDAAAGAAIRQLSDPALVTALKQRACAAAAAKWNYEAKVAPVFMHLRQAKCGDVR